MDFVFFRMKISFQKVLSYLEESNTFNLNINTLIDWNYIPPPSTATSFYTRDFDQGGSWGVVIEKKEFPVLVRERARWDIKMRSCPGWKQRIISMIRNWR